MKECEYLIGHHVTEEFYGVVTSKEVLQRMVGNLLNLGKRWVVTEVIWPVSAVGEKRAHGVLSACLILPLRSTGVSALKRHQSHQAVLKALDVTSQCLVAFDHLLQQYCLEARIDSFHSRKWTQLCCVFFFFTMWKADRNCSLEGRDLYDDQVGINHMLKWVDGGVGLLTICFCFQMSC